MVDNLNNLNKNLDENLLKAITKQLINLINQIE